MTEHRDVAVLGCGPAGLLVAWAVERAGHFPHIISNKIKSEIPGSQHLHGPVPGLTSVYPEGSIQFVRIGTAKGYALKVYDDEDRNTGWENYLQVFPSWNVIKAYDKLWDHFEDRIDDTHVLEGGDWVVREAVLGHDMVISTLPAQVLCHRRGEHKFNSAPYYIKTLPTPPGDEEHEIVVYNGLGSDHWYRWSILGGKCSIESTKPFPEMRHSEQATQEARPIPVIQGHKAIDTNCDCWPFVQRAGRWAEWKHGVTMYHAYKKAEALMRGDGPWLT